MNDEGVAIAKTKLEAHFRHEMPSGDFPRVAELKNLSTGLTTEFRTYREQVYRIAHDRTREVSGGVTFERLPAAEATAFVASVKPGPVGEPTHPTLAYQGSLWVKSELPSYRVLETSEAICVAGGWDTNEGTAFNALQKNDAVNHALRLGVERDLPMHQTHKITLSDPTTAGPAAATIDGSAALNTVRQRLSTVLEATAVLQAATGENEVLQRMSELAKLVAKLENDVLRAGNTKTGFFTPAHA